MIEIDAICLWIQVCSFVIANTYGGEWACACIVTYTEACVSVWNAPSPGAGGAACLWHLWSRDSVQEPPLCRCNAHLHPEPSCTPATLPLAWWSAQRDTCSHKYTAHISTDDVTTLTLQHTAVMFCYFVYYRSSILLPSAPKASTPTNSTDLEKVAALKEQSAFAVRYSSAHCVWSPVNFLFNNK